MYVRVMPGRGVLDVRHVDGDAAGGLLRGLVDAVGRYVTGETLSGQHLGDGRGEGGLAVVDVSHGADVQMRLGPQVGLPGHVPLLPVWGAGDAPRGGCVYRCARGAETRGVADPPPWGLPAC